MGVDTAVLANAALSDVLRATKQGRRAPGRPLVAMDAAAGADFLERYPGAARIGLSYQGMRD